MIDVGELSITIVVPTRNRAASLRSCIDALASQRHGRFDILVVDNGGTDDTEAVVRECAARSIVPVAYCCESRPGVSHARNCGLRTASSDLIAFVDDDCYPDRDWLRHIAAEFADPTVAYVGGRLLLHDTTDALFTVNESATRLVRRAGEWNEGDDIPGTGMAVRRAALLEVGGYDPLLGAGAPLRSGEDIDMHSRLCAAGWTGVFTPDAITYHAHGRKPGSSSLRQLQAGYALGRGAWYVKRIVLGPRRLTTIYSWAVWRAPRQSLATTLGEFQGLFRYVARAVPRIVRRGRSGLHPRIVAAGQGSGTR